MIAVHKVQAWAKGGATMEKVARDLAIGLSDCREKNQRRNSADRIEMPGDRFLTATPSRTTFCNISGYFQT